MSSSSSSSSSLPPHASSGAPNPTDDDETTHHDHSFSATTTPPPQVSLRERSAAGEAGLSELERRVLDEYERLLGNVNELGSLLGELAQEPPPQILDSLRGLERKTSLVFTLLKASVYSIVLQQQIGEEEGG